jgi:hypothetical protein
VTLLRPVPLVRGGRGAPPPQVYSTPEGRKLLQARPGAGAGGDTRLASSPSCKPLINSWPEASHFTSWPVSSSVQGDNDPAQRGLTEINGLSLCEKAAGVYTLVKCCYYLGVGLRRARLV